MLVRAAEAWIRSRFSSVARSMIVLADLPESAAHAKPGRIGGFVPDVHATTHPSAVTVIGEAKCQPDLTTERSHRQLTAFLEHLAVRENGHLVLAVARQDAGPARRVLRSLLRERAAANVRVLLLVPPGEAVIIATQG